MKNTGTIIDIDGEKAYVFVNRAPACEGCRRRCYGETVCSTAKKDAVITDNTVGAQIGDKVTVSVKTGRTVAFLAALFVVPPLLAILTYFVLNAAVTEQSVICALSSFAVLAVSFTAIYLIFGRRIMKGGSCVKLEGIAERG